MLKEMSSRAFNSSYDSYMRNAYDLWVETDFKEEESDYAKGVQALDSVLTEDQQQKLKAMEDNYQLNMEYASRYGFKAGLYSGFSQYFIGTEVAYEGFETTGIPEGQTETHKPHHLVPYSGNRHCCDLGLQARLKSFTYECIR